MNKEIERLNSAKSYAELKMLSLITRKENLIEWIVKNPAGVIVLENFEDFDKCISKAEDDYAKTIMTIALPCNMEEKTLSEVIENFELSRKFIKGTQGLKEMFIFAYNENLKRYPFYEVMFNIFNQKASMGSTDGASIVLRDIIIEIFFQIYKNPKNELLAKVIKLSQEDQSFLAVLEKIVSEYSWGEKI